MVGDLGYLEELDVSSNCIAFLPSEIGRLKRLRALIARPLNHSACASVLILFAWRGGVDLAGAVLVGFQGGAGEFRILSFDLTVVLLLLLPPPACG